jgi:hypothetical protein
VKTFRRPVKHYILIGKDWEKDASGPLSGEANIDRHAKTAGSVENDPKPTFRLAASVGPE